MCITLLTLRNGQRNKEEPMDGKICDISEKNSIQLLQCNWITFHGQQKNGCVYSIPKQVLIIQSNCIFKRGSCHSAILFPFLCLCAAHPRELTSCRLDMKIVFLKEEFDPIKMTGSLMLWNIRSALLYFTFHWYTWRVQSTTVWKVLPEILLW